MWRTLTDVQTVARRLDDAAWCIFDCRFSLGDTEQGRRAYLDSHIPGAVYVHLDEDMSGPPTTDRGRHPLPTPAALVALFSRLGIDAGKQVVAYDDMGGAVAARLWWMLRYLGHEAVAVLDGGWQAWQAAGWPVQAGMETNEPALFTGSPRQEWLVQIEEVDGVPLLIDSRSPARYRGEEEPWDDVAGHIPGAANCYYQENLQDGRYLAPVQLRQRLGRALGQTAPDEAVFYCGSGVSACANLLALAHAGLGNGRLYVGSWSEWSRDARRPIATGDE